jgi:SAM-dependent methyltransferase
MDMMRKMVGMLPPNGVARLRNLRRRMQGIPVVGAVDFGDLRRLTPMSRAWGFDRGTPIDRYYIERFMASHAGDVRGRVLEVGEDVYTRRFGADRVTRVDVLNLTPDCPGVTIIADLADAPQIPDGQFDCVILTQVLQAIFDAPAAVRTLHRILAPGGVLLMTVPGISRAEATPDSQDAKYWSFSELSVRTLLGLSFEPANVSTVVGGNVFAAVAFLEGLAVEEVGPAALEYLDMDYQVNVAARAVRSSVGP